MKRILAYLGVVLAVLGLSMFFPMVVGYLDGDGSTLVFGLLGTAGFAVGVGLFMGFREAEEMTSGDAYLLVTSAWLVAGVYGAIVYMLCGLIPDFPRAFFEAISGFTTTGASVIPDVESLERSVLLWRSMTFWLGGLGIVALFVSLFSMLGNSGMQMFKAEATGPIIEKITPRISEMAKILWRVYVALTAVIILSLILVGMEPFNAVCHGFGVISTGGFSDKNDSIAAFSLAIQLTLAFCAMISGVRVDLFYAAFKKKSLKVFWINEEFRVYMGMLFGAVLITALILWGEGHGFLAALASSFVQLTSAISSTGFVSADFTSWPPVGQLFMLVLPFIGACAGSAGGGMKAGRILILIKEIRASFTRMLHPKAVVNLRVNGRVVPPEIVENTQSFFFIYIMITIASTVLFCLVGYDMLMSFSIVGACINNVGTAFDSAGPLIHYGEMPAWSMFYLSFLMLAGRLELYTILILFSKGYWRES